MIFFFFLPLNWWKRKHSTSPSPLTSPLWGFRYQGVSSGLPWFISSSVWRNWPEMLTCLAEGSWKRVWVGQSPKPQHPPDPGFRHPLPLVCNLTTEVIESVFPCCSVFFHPPPPPKMTLFTFCDFQLRSVLECQCRGKIPEFACTWMFKNDYIFTQQTMSILTLSFFKFKDTSEKTNVAL